MLLCDQVAQSCGVVRIQGDNGAIYSMSGAATCADAVRTCATRYILEETVADNCHILAGCQADLLALTLKDLLSPHQIFWIEWQEPRRGPGASGTQKVGILVEAEDGGERGRLRSFWEQDGAPEMGQGWFEFDFRHEISCGVRRQSGGLDSLSPTRLSNLDSLFRHASFNVAPEWLAFVYDNCRSPQQLLTNFRGLFRAQWTDFLLFCGFVYLLNQERVLSTAKSDPAPLNRRRARSGVAPLLDHVQVRMCLDGDGSRSEQGPQSHRAGPRLHQVRGHLVRRMGKIFWRSCHLRGDPFSPMASTRTILVGRRRMETASRLAAGLTME